MCSRTWSPVSFFPRPRRNVRAGDATIVQIKYNNCRKPLIRWFPPRTRSMKGMQTSRGRPGHAGSRLAVFVLGLLIGPVQAARADGEAVPFDTQVRPILEAR